MGAATPYSYGLRNLYRPTTLIPNAYGWSQRPSYQRADVPTGLASKPGAMTDVEFLQQFAYEWYQSAQLNGNRNLSNPPFLSGAAGRLHPALRDSETGHRARILRGYIRRAQTEAGDEMSKARLYFMYNPENITRDYVSYLNQSALDPFNSVYQSGNLVAPPSFMDFSFSLFFDRQEEAMQRNHPGVFVDYQFFDLVVRNVIPTDPNQSGNTLPDNGVMMVNPRDICVVFSPQLSVQGRPLNATVNFEKFTHRMTPTRMSITLQMRVIYMGPVRDAIEYKAEELQAEAAIPMGDAPVDFMLSYEANEEQTTAWFNDTGIASNNNVGMSFAVANAANTQARLTALQWAKDNVVQGGPGDGPWTDYVAENTGSKRYNIPQSDGGSADPSGLITEAYIKTGNGQAMAWYDHPGVSVILERARKYPERGMLTSLDTFDFTKDLQPGDILIRNGHMAFFDYYDGNRIMIFDAGGASGAPEVGSRVWAGRGGYEWFLLRPTPVASTSGLAGTSVWQDINTGQHGASTNVGAATGTLTYAQTVEAFTGQGPNIRLSLTALSHWNAWRTFWMGPIPCTSGWRDPVDQQKNYLKNPARFAPASSSWHCKGLAVDVNMDWLGALSASEQTRFRVAARNAGWGQPRWRLVGGPAPGYEAPCNPQKGTKTDEPWHFSWGGCG